MLKHRNNFLIWARTALAYMFICGLVGSSSLFSQPFHREIETIPIIINNDTISQPFAGGVDAPNHRFVDIDNDGDYDLFVLDTDGNLDFYRNTGTPQQANFKLRRNEITLPPFSAWFLFVNLNADSLIDLLTDNGGNSISYYTNWGTTREPSFVLSASPMLDTSGNPIVSGFIGIPAFSDIDGDNDFDFFASNFDGSITMYQNIGSPLYPIFRFADGRFQNFAIINDSCIHDPPVVAMNKQSHHGGSILLFGDINDDGANDLFMGDLNSHSMFFLANNGSPVSPLLQCSGGYFPPDSSLNTSGYNQPNLVDIDADDDLDLFVGAFLNMGSSSMQRRSFWFYENTGNASSPNYQLITKEYLSTLDAGRNAHPAIHDLNGDNKPDLLIGNVNGQLWYFEHTGTPTTPSFTLIDTLFAGIKGNFSYSPALVDLDGDNDLDLAVGQFDGKVKLYRNNDSTGAAVFGSNPYDSISTAQYAAPAFTDIDGDLDYDMVVGTSNGRIRFYRNTGSAFMFIPSLVSTYFDSIDVGENATPLFIDIDNDEDDDLFIGSESGKLFFYEQTGAGEFTFQTDSFATIHPLKESSPAFADLDDDGDIDLLVGTSKGGLHFYRNEKPVGVENPAPEIQVPTQVVLYQNYPNPFNPATVIRYSLPVASHVTLKIYSIPGSEVATLVQGVQPAGAQSIVWNASGLPAGVYFCQITTQSLYGRELATFTGVKKLLLLK